MDNKNSSAAYWLPVSIIVGAIIVGGAVLYEKSGSTSSNNNTNNNNQQQQNQTEADISKVKVDGEPFVGNTTAPVTVAVWTDYQCPFCQKLEQESISKMVDDYVKSGKVRIIFKDWAFLGQDSQTAAIAGRAVWEADPAKFFAWHDAMFNKQGQENSGWATKDKILALTQSLGIDSAKVGQLMTQKADEYQKEIDADKAEGTSFGINGTPGTIIGKQLIVGSEPYTTFKSAIDALLSAK